jgi:type VI secretion system protein VasG
LCKDPETIPSPEALSEAIRPELLAAKSERGVPIFKQAFLGRLIVVTYFPISEVVLRQIIRLQLDRIAQRMRQNHNARFSYSDDLIEVIASRCREVESGARNVDNILTRTLLPELSQEILSRMTRGEAIRKVHVTTGSNGAFAYALE